MNETHVEGVAWRRQGRPREYVGDFELGESGVRLSGHDPANGIDVTLVIPYQELRGAHVSRTRAESLDRQRSVVLELAGSDAILLRGLGVGSLHVHALARRLAALAAGRSCARVTPPLAATTG